MSTIQNRNKLRTLVGATILAAGLASGSALATVTFDPDTGEGFAGKGAVQLAHGLNNKGLQDAAANVRIRAVVEMVTEVSWTCTNSRNENTQVRERTTTTGRQGLVTTVARDGKKQVTGFFLKGYTGSPSFTSTSEGNQLNSCPDGPWTLTTPAGDPVKLSETEAFEVSIDEDRTDWTVIE